MCEHKVYWDFNLCTFLSPFTKNEAIILVCFLFSPKDTLVVGMKAEIAYKQMSFMSFKNILREGGNEVL